MSKTWKEQPRSKRGAETPQRAIDRLRKAEAREDIEEALVVSPEVRRGGQRSAQS